MGNTASIRHHPCPGGAPHPTSEFHCASLCQSFSRRPPFCPAKSRVGLWRCGARDGVKVPPLRDGRNRHGNRVLARSRRTSGHRIVPLGNGSDGTGSLSCRRFFGNGFGPAPWENRIGCSRVILAPASAARWLARCWAIADCAGSTRFTACGLQTSFCAESRPFNRGNGWAVLNIGFISVRIFLKPGGLKFVSNNNRPNCFRWRGLSSAQPANQNVMEI
jgi:hypothetical protein